MGEVVFNAKSLQFLLRLDSRHLTPCVEKCREVHGEDECVDESAEHDSVDDASQSGTLVRMQNEGRFTRNL